MSLLAALEDLGCGYALVSPTSGFLEVNDALGEMTGYTREELLALPGLTAIVAPDDRERVAGNIARRLRGEPLPVGRRAELVTKAGRRILVDKATGAVTGDGETKAICLFRLVPADHGPRDPESAQQKLRVTREYLEYLVAESPVIIAAGRADEIAYGYISPNVERILGYRAEEIVGNPTWVADHVHPDDLGPALASLAEALEQRAEECDVILRYRHRDGSYRWFRLVFRIDYDAPGGVPRTLGYNIDITERIEAERERELLRAQLDRGRTLQAVGQLAGGVAHDFNNLLMVIGGFSEQLAIRTEDLLSGQGLEHDEVFRQMLRDAAEVERAVQKGAALTRQLLSFASGGTNRSELQDLNEIVADLDSLLRSLGENIELEVDPDPGLWVIKADAAQLQQVLVNLAINARDAMPAGGTLSVATENSELDEVWCSVRPGLAPGRYARLSVSDTGMGMSPEVQARAFEPFFTTKDVGRGSGMGLASAYGIVTGTGGTIELTSQPGFGTSIDCYFPAASERIVARERITAAEPSPGHGERILLVEDEEAVRVAIRRSLVDNGYVVLEAAGPGEAMELCRRETGPIDLLLTDIVMPRMSGVDLARWVADTRPGIAIVFMSGYTADFLSRQGAATSATLLLPKPFTRTRLLTVLRSALDVGSARPGSGSA